MPTHTFIIYNSISQTEGLALGVDKMKKTKKAVSLILAFAMVLSAMLGCMTVSSFATEGRAEEVGQIKKDASTKFDASGKLDFPLEFSGTDEWKKAVSEVTIQEVTEEDTAEAKTYTKEQAGINFGDSSVTLNSSCFDNSKDRAAYRITLKAENYPDSTAEVTVRNYSAKSFQLRIVGKDNVVYPIKTYTKAKLEEMAKPGEYQVGCGMSGVRNFYAKGVLLTDLLKDAGIEVGPGMTIQLRTNDSAKVDENDSTTDKAYYRNGTFTYENLLGKTRYYFPGVFDNSEFLKTVNSAADGKWGTEVRTALAGTNSKAAKVEVTPMICTDYVEKVYRDDQNRPTAADLEATNSLNSNERSFRFLFGLAMDDEIVSKETTTWSATYCMFGIDIIDPNYSPSSSSGGNGGGGGSAVAKDYTVTFDSNGGSDVAKQTVTSGEKVNKPADPTREGYEFAGWYTDSKLTTAYDFSSKVTKSITLYAKWTEKGAEPEPSTSFKDVAADAWYAEYVSYLAGKGIVNGKTADTFAPDAQITRAEFIKIIAGVAGADVSGKSSSRFSDVASDAWYAPYVAWGVENGIINGTSETTFHPNGNISRQDMATMIKRYTDFAKFTLPADTAAVNFTDSAQISSYAADAVKAMQQAGIINGKGGNTFAPKDNATRAEACKMLTVLMKMMEA